MSAEGLWPSLWPSAASTRPPSRPSRCPQAEDTPGAGRSLKGGGPAFTWFSRRYSLPGRHPRHREIRYRAASAAAPRGPHVALRRSPFRSVHPDWIFFLGWFAFSVVLVRPVPCAACRPAFGPTRAVGTAARDRSHGPGRSTALSTADNARWRTAAVASCGMRRDAVRIVPPGVAHRLGSKVRFHPSKVCNFARMRTTRCAGHLAARAVRLWQAR